MTKTIKGPSALLGYSVAMAALLLSSSALAGLSASAIPFDPRADLQASINGWTEELTALVEKTEKIVAEADAANRDLTDDEVETIASNNAEAAKLEKKIKALSSTASLSASAGRKTVQDPAAAANGGRIQVSKRNDPRHGFSSFGEFAQAVQAHAKNQNTNAGVQKLVAAATTYGNENIGADGGFAVPPEFRTQILQKVMSEENLLTRCDVMQTGANSMQIPKDETTPWQTSGGIQVYWEAEGSPATASKPSLGKNRVELEKLFGLVPVSDELLADAPGLESYLRAKAPMKMTAKINTAIINGTGAGQPLGILRAPGTVSVAKETSQPADTVRYANIVKMWSRLYGPWRSNAVWLINQDIEPQLLAMSFDPAATSKVPVYLPPGGVSSSPYATLMGRPVLPLQACSTLGDKGDIILADMQQYMALTKAGEDIRTDTSIHLFFDQAITAFRFIFRVNGQPWWEKPIDPQNGTNTLSAFVTLDDRT